MTARRALLVALALAVLALGLAGWTGYRHVRASYDGFRARIQPGIKIAGVDVGWLTPDEARAQVAERIANPYAQDFSLSYREADGSAPAAWIDLSPVKDLALQVHVDEMLAQAQAASHHYDYWQGFWRWVRGQVETADVNVPLQMTFDESAAARFMAGVARQQDRAPTEPMVDVQKAAFLPGVAGRRLDVEAAARLVNDRAPDPSQREVDLPVLAMEPDQSAARIESMLSTLVPVMERPPTAPSFYTATIPISSTGGVAGTPLVTYTGELTWTFPYFAGYQGPLTTTSGFFFDLGKSGARFDVERAVNQVEMALQAGATTPITFQADPVPPAPPAPDLLIPPLEARLATFPGVSSLLVKNLDTGAVIYDRNNDYVLSGMSVVKIGIMIEVYRYYKGAVNAQTHQELMDMLGSSSCNPCANRLLTAVGDGSAAAGAQRVTSTMQRLGLSHFRLCGPFRIVENWNRSGGIALATGHAGFADAGYWLAAAGTPRADGCVHATPREMASLLEMILQGTKGEGQLTRSAPAAFSPQVCQDMIDTMAANDLRNMLGSGIPAEVKLAHKHGFAGYDVPWGDTRAEVGIVFSPGATYLVSFYIWEDSPWIDFGIVQPLYRDVSNLLYNYLNAGHPYWPPPPWAPSPTQAGAVRAAN